VPHGRCGSPNLRRPNVSRPGKGPTVLKKADSGLEGLLRKTSIVGSMLPFGHSLRRLRGWRSEEADQSSNVLRRSCHQRLFSYVPKSS